MNPDDLAALLADMTDEQIAAFVATLPTDDLAQVETALGVGWRATPATMAHHLTAGRFKLWRYHQLLGQKFRDAAEGRSIRQIWNMPPRYGKSEEASRWGPAWALDRNPGTRLILVSYGDDLAMENAFLCRNILREHRKVLRAQLIRDRQRQDRFMTDRGGGVLAAGINSGITGFGADGVVFDDPYKNWVTAHSAAYRDLVDRQYQAVVSTRLETEHAWVIVVLTRWHEDDIAGRLLQRMQDGTGEAWELIRIPAIAEAPDPYSSDLLRRLPDPLGRQPGEIIEPERFTAQAVAARHLTLGTYLTAAMEQQRPAPEEGGEFKRWWWRLEDAMPERYDETITSWDMKLKDKESGDYVVGQAWGRTGKDAWLVEQLRGQYNFATTCNAIALLAIRHPTASRHIIENTGNGPEVMVELRDPKPGYDVSDDIASQLGMTVEERVQVQKLRQRGLSGIIARNVKGDKIARARAVSGQIEAGDVHLPARAPWVGAFLDEFAAFPAGGSHDDQVDACSQALAALRQGSGSVTSAARMTVPKTPISTGTSGGMLGGRGRMVIPTRVR